MRILENPSFIRGGGAGRSRNHGDQRGSDGVADVDMKKDGQQRHEHDPSTEAGERSEKSREKGDERHDGGESQNGHAIYLG